MGDTKIAGLATEVRPTAVDLFAGAGGFSLGAEQAGADVLAAVEYDPVCAAVHRYNFPRTEVVCADMATLTARRLKDSIRTGWRSHARPGEWDGKIDFVVGGPPCQGFSVGGKRAFDDPRNQLVFDFARIVGALKPRYFAMENVPGLATIRAGANATAPKLLDLLVEEFDAFGYEVQAPEVLNAFNFGVPQYRRRLILLGWRKGEQRPEYPSSYTRGLRPTGEALSGEADIDKDPCPNVWDALRDLPDLDRYPESLHSDEIEMAPDEVPTLEREASGYARALRGGRDRNDFGYRRRWDRKIITSSCRTTHRADVRARFARTRTGHREAVSHFFRLSPTGVSPTLRAGTHYDRGSFNAPRPIHPQHDRVISVREAARLHSFPDWFRFHWTKWHGFREVGNSLPPRVARAVVAELVRAMGIEPAKPKKAIGLGDPSLLYLENMEAAEQFGVDLSRIPRNELRRRSLDIVA
jgi:DNA (cytosine-5)-methyltransferase 1